MIAIGFTLSSFTSPDDETLLPYLKNLAWLGLTKDIHGNFITKAWEVFASNLNNADMVMEIENIFEQETNPYYDINTEEKGTPCE